MELTHEEVVRDASMDHGRGIFFTSPMIIEDGVYMSFNTPHPGFFWCKPDDRHSKPPAFIVDGTTGEVQNSFCIKRVSALGDAESFPWQTVENDGIRAQTAWFTMACDAERLLTREGAEELRCFLQACLGEGEYVAVSNFQFRS